MASAVLTLTLVSLGLVDFMSLYILDFHVESPWSGQVLHQGHLQVEQGKCEQHLVASANIDSCATKPDALTARTGTCPIAPPRQQCEAYCPHQKKATVHNKVQARTRTKEAVHNSSRGKSCYCEDGNNEKL